MQIFGDRIIILNKNKTSIQLSPVWRIIDLFFFLSLFACSLGPSRKDIIKEYEKAVNAHQTSSLLALFSADAQTDFIGMSPPLVGKESLTGKARYDSTLGNQISLSIIKVKRDTVFATAIEKNKWLIKVGLPYGANISMTFVVKKGTITYLRSEMSDSSMAVINNVMASLIPWAEQNQPEKLNQLMPNGAFAYSAESARLSLELLTEWAAQHSAM
jgi:hypothetical protein